MSRVFVTGVAGFIGSRLAAHLSSCGHCVRGSVRRLSDADVVRPGVSHPIVLPLEEAPPVGAFREVDVVVHLAFDPSPASARANLEGTLRLADEAAACGVRQQVFVSSYSAAQQAVTAYGRTKWALEERFREAAGTIVRPGLVIGPGGLFGRLVRAVTRLPVVPLVDGGAAQVPVVGLDDLVIALEALVRAETPGEHDLFLPGLVRLRRIVDEMLRLLRKRSLIVPVPAAVLAPALDLSAALGLVLPIHGDNVRALRANQAIRRRSTLGGLVGRPESLERMLEKALGGSRA